MEKINTEVVVSSLFNIGFDKVDCVLFALIMARIAIDDKNNFFDFNYQKTSYIFNKYVDYDGHIFKLKDGFSIDTNVSQVERFERTLGKTLITNPNLIEYLNNLDFSEIVLKKVELYGIQSIDEVDETKFSQKEIEILKLTKLGQTKNNKTLNLKK